MDTALSQIHWNVPNGFRLAAIILEFVLVLDTAMLVAHRHYRINPVLKRLGNEILGPPPFWGSAYHVMVGVMVSIQAIATAQRMTFSGQSTIAVWTTPFVMVAFIVVTRMFARSYTERLRRYEHDHYR